MLRSRQTKQTRGSRYRPVTWPRRRVSLPRWSATLSLWILQREGHGRLNKGSRPNMHKARAGSGAWIFISLQLPASLAALCLCALPLSWDDPAKALLPVGHPWILTAVLNKGRQGRDGMQGTNQLRHRGPRRKGWMPVAAWPRFLNGLNGTYRKAMTKQGLVTQVRRHSSQQQQRRDWTRP